MTKRHPIVAIDIDGTLGDHYSHMVQFAEMWLGHEVKYNPAAGWPNGAPKFQFNKALGVSKATYRKIKLAYRHGGMVRSMPAYEGATELTEMLRVHDVQIWICTSRPYLKMDYVDPDSRHWLRINKIKYDHLLYGDRKYIDLVKQVGRENVICVLDDLTEMYAQAQRVGLEPLLIERPHNQYRPLLPRMRSVESLWDAGCQIVEAVERARGR